jgi:L-lactate dehydrogenase complex protein LldG
MTGSRDKILTRLRSAQAAIETSGTADEYLPVVPLPDAPADQLQARFVEQATRLGCEVHACGSQADALTCISGLLGADKRVLAWDFANIPLPGLAAMFTRDAIELASPRDDSVRVGITGVDAALASTGSLVIEAGPGKPRVPSLLPPVHIAVVSAQQIMPNLEAWVAHLRSEGLDRFRQTSGIVLVSGPSRTADIAMQLIMGMHGPGQVHIVLVG